MVRPYRFQSNAYCGRCTVEVAHDALYALPLIEPIDVEDYLDRVAHFRGIDRLAGYTFSNEDFPKPLSNLTIKPGMKCHKCGKRITRSFKT